ALEEVEVPERRLERGAVGLGEADGVAEQEEPAARTDAEDGALREPARVEAAREDLAEDGLDVGRLGERLGDAAQDRELGPLRRAPLREADVDGDLPLEAMDEPLLAGGLRGRVERDDRRPRLSQELVDLGHDLGEVARAEEERVGAD